MLFDWFTIIAQIINFLILMFLLRRFLYKPILNTMEAREQRIATLLEEAEHKKKAAEEERQRFLSKNADWQANVEHRKQEMEEELNAWRKKEMQAARDQVDRSLKAWFDTVEDHKTDFLNDLNQFTVQKTYAIARRALQDLAGKPLETQMIEAFLANLERRELNLSPLAPETQREGSAVLKIRSAFDIDPEMKERLQAALKDYLGDDVPMKFETAPDLAAGIEVVGSNGYTAAWNLSRYLEALQSDLDEQFHAHLGEHEQIEETVSEEANGDG